MPSLAVLARRFTRLTAAAALLALLCSSCTMAVRTTVRDQRGAPLEDAVVYATPGQKRASVGARTRAAMTVENLEFRPPVLPVRVGGSVTFLNRDDVAHQVYSISRAKNFERFVGGLSASNEVVFDRPGPVVLGCATHDSMIGHIYVLDTPYFAVTGKDGKAELRDLPRGIYDVRVWHPAMQASPVAAARRVTDGPSHAAGVDFAIAVHERRPPGGATPPAAPGARGD